MSAEWCPGTDPGQGDDTRAFDHRDPGSSADEWAAAITEAAPAAVDLTEVTDVIVLSPHPDDETLAVGGLIASAAAAGLPVTILLLTDGEGSHPDSPTHDREAISALRRVEFAEATALLDTNRAPSARSAGRRLRVQRLGLPDGGVAEATGTVADALRSALAGAGHRPLVIAPLPHDGHTDHDAAGRVARDVCDDQGADADLWWYPVWWWHRTSPDDGGIDWPGIRLFRLDAVARAAKAAAMNAYRSQFVPLGPDAGDEAVVDKRHREHFTRTFEVFMPVTRGPAGEATNTQGQRAVADTSRTRDDFERHYARTPEGWDFAGNWYEQRKRDVLLAALPRPRFGAALEVGCSTGVLTAQLTARCDWVVGIDIAEAPLSAARLAAPSARFLRATVPRDWPAGAWDLVVFSEIGYYLSRDDLAATLAKAYASLTPEGIVVLCHWRHPAPDTVTPTEEVHRLAAASWPGRTSLHLEDEDFLLDVLVAGTYPAVSGFAGLR